MIGLRTVGCCVHVATLISYLGKYKYTPFKLPGIHLDSVLARMDQPSNFPPIVRNKRICRRKDPESSSEDDSIDIIDSSDSESSESDFTANSDNEIGSNAGSDNDSNDDNDNASGGSLENNTLPVVRVNAESRLAMNSPVPTNIMFYNNTDLTVYPDFTENHQTRTMPILSTLINATNMNSVIEHLPRSNASRSESEASGTRYMLNEPTSQLSRSESEASGTRYMLNKPTSQLSRSESEASGTRSKIKCNEIL